MGFNTKSEYEAFRINSMVNGGTEFPPFNDVVYDLLQTKFPGGSRYAEIAHEVAMFLETNPDTTDMKTAVSGALNALKKAGRVTLTDDIWKAV